jgi:hypothetical protein
VAIAMVAVTLMTVAVVSWVVLFVVVVMMMFFVVLLLLLAGFVMLIVARRVFNVGCVMVEPESAGGYRIAE